MKVGIIGAGITGLTAAYELSKRNIEVELLEADSQIGGIAASTSIDGIAIEKYYHHFFKSDLYVKALAEELGLRDKMRWHQSRMGFYVDGKLYDFGTPLSLLKFKPLPFFDKFRFGAAILRIMGTKYWKQLENIPAHKWIRTNAGEAVFKKVWKPLLTTKFGEQYQEVAMSWFWGKIKLRGSSKENGKEVLGYIEGSTKVLLDALRQRISEGGGSIRLNCSALCIERKKQGFLIHTSEGDFCYDNVLCTTSLPIFLDLAKEILPMSYLEQKRQIEYTSVACTLLILNRSFSSYYWLNIGDELIPFGGLIEHTNLIDKAEYGDKHLLYISNYLYKDSDYYKMSDEELIRSYIPQLQKINPDFNEDWIVGSSTYRDAYAQPVIKQGYSKIRPSIETPIAGLYTASMCNIYPEDRGVNYAIRDGRHSAGFILNPRQ